jgi:DNA-binding response OmpR family regulator
MGIPTTHISHLFERFYRTTATELQAGSGLGLALTRELTELHGGTIAVDSKENEGALFTIDIPIEIVPSQNQAMSKLQASGMENKYTHPDLVKPKLGKQAEPSATERLTPVDKPVILIAEDNADVRGYVVEQLGSQYHILEAENGIQGLELATEKMPDLIITDIMMPEMDGTTLCSTLKSQEKTSHIPIIMLTALAEQSEKLKGLDTGADDYLIKPFDVAELRMRVSNLIEQRRRLHAYFRNMLNVFTPTGIDAENMDAVFLRKVREAVESNMDDEQFSVVELSAHVGMSRSQLHRKLSALTDLSPNQVIRQMRLEKAKLLLDKKSGTVSEIAYLCGFSSPAYFIKCFREHFGKTPGEVSISS